MERSRQEVQISAQSVYVKLRMDETMEGMQVG